MNILSGKYLSDIIGAHDLSDFVMEVQLVSASSHVLVRGAVVCRKADGTVTLAGAEGTGPDDVFGIVLNFGTDPSSGGATASVARSGVYDAVQLTVDPGVELRDFADRLRKKGSFWRNWRWLESFPSRKWPLVRHILRQHKERLSQNNHRIRLKKTGAGPPISRACASNRGMAKANHEHGGLQEP